MNRFLLLLFLFVSFHLTYAQEATSLQFDTYSTNDGLSHRIISNIIQDRKGYIWMATWNGLCRYDASGFETWNVLPDGSAIGRLLRIQETKDGKICCYANDGNMYIFDPVTYRFFKSSGEPVLNPLPVNPYLLEVGQGGLSIERNGICYFLPVKSNKRLGSTLHASFTDRQGNLWINFDDLLYKVFFPSKSGFYHTYVEGAGSALFGDEIRSITVGGDGRLWLGSKNGNVYLYNAAGKFEGYLSPEGSLCAHPVPFPANPYVIREDKAGRMWIGTKGSGLYCFTPLNGGGRYEVAHYTRKSGKLTDDRVYSLYFENPDRLWVGTFGNGLSIIDLSGKSFRVLKTALDKVKIRYIAPFKGLFALATTSGLYLCDREGVLKQKIGNADMTFICTTQSGDTYVSSMGAGLFKLMQNGTKRELVPLRSEVVPYDVVLSITEEKSGNLLLVSDNNLIRMFPGGNVQTFDQKFFNRNITFSEASPVVKNNSILLGAADGYVSFCVDSLTHSIPSLYWKSVQVGDSVLSFADDDSVLVVSKGERIRIKPVALDYRPGHIRYGYRLQNDSVWILSKENGVVEIDNLPLGSHRLQIRSTDSYGIWSSNERTLVVKVKPSFYFWSGLAGVFFFVAFIVLIVYKRMNRKIRSAGQLDIFPSLPPSDSPDGRFLEAAILFVESNMDKPEISVDDFAEHMKMSRTVLYARMKELLDKTPASFIKEMRIKRAIQLLELRKYTVAEVAYMTGFSDAKYFGKVFKKETGMPPLAYVDKLTASKKNDSAV